MIETCLVVLGGLGNVFRGGGLFSLPGETQKDKRTQVRRISFVVLFGLISYIFTDADEIQVLTASVLLFGMLLTGWGRAVGAVGGWEDKPLKEFWPIDQVANLFLLFGKVTWGFVWLTTWGFLTGLVVSSGLLGEPSADVVLLSSTMGAVYWVGLRLSAWFRLNVWALSEGVYGALFFAGFLM